MTRIGLTRRAQAPAGRWLRGLGDRRAIGSGVDNVQVGDRVLAMDPLRWLQRRRLPEQDAGAQDPGLVVTGKGGGDPGRLPDRVDHAHPLGNVQKGDWVSSTPRGRGRASGAADLQVRGANVIGTASKSKHARLLDNGVAHCIDYTTEDFEERVTEITKGGGVDIVLDAVGGESFARATAASRRSGASTASVPRRSRRVRCAASSRSCNSSSHCRSSSRSR